MKYIKIQNKGILDERLIPLMGGTTKRENQYKIGQFGTGLKYVLAFMFRNNLSIKMFVGEREVILSTIEEEIQGNIFKIICIDGVRTSITAQMGYDWNHWMIVREIWCNALDEGDAKREITENVNGEADKTTIYLEYNLEFAKVWQNWSNYFIQEFEPLFETKEYALYPGTDKLRIYKQGVLIHESNESLPSIFNYDIKNADINELRSYIGTKSYDIHKCLVNIADKKIIEYFLQSVTEKHYEGNMDYDWGTKFNDAWKETIGNSKLIHQEAVETIKSKGLDIDLTRVLIVPKKVFKILTKTFEGIGALRTSNKVNEFYETYDQSLELLIKQGLVILEQCDYDFSPELKFIYGVFGDKTTWAQVNLDKKEVLISENIKDKSLFEIVTTLIEENEHFKTGMQDHTREFQQHWINLYTKTLINKHGIKL